MFKEAAIVGLQAVKAGEIPIPSSIDDKAILDWCFVIGSLNLAVIGFLYNTYATAKFEDFHGPPIVEFLRRFIRALAFALVVLASLAFATAYHAGVPFSAWLIVSCLIFVTAWSVMLAWKLD